MRAVVFLGDRRLEVRDFPTPEPGPGEVRVRMMATGICGSDLHVYRRDTKHFAGRTSMPGHEPSGVVDALGDGVARLQLGDRVSVNHWRGCGHCRWCAAGHFAWCAEGRAYSGGPIGSHAEFVLADERGCVRLPESLSFLDGAFIACAGGTAYSALRKLQVSGHETLVISGLGPVGLSGVVLAKAFGGTVIGVDVVQERVELAAALGADVVINAADGDPVSAIRDGARSDGCELSFETSGSQAGRSTALSALGRGGKAVFVGFGGDDLVIDEHLLVLRELTLMGSLVLPMGQSHELADFLDKQGLSFEQIVTHQFGIEDADEAYRAADDSKTGKVVFVWD